MVSRRNLEGIVKMGFSLTPEQVAWLNDRAASEDRSMSAVIRRLIDEEALRVEAGWVSPIGSKAPPEVQDA
jgi:hypothetical protein